MNKEIHNCQINGVHVYNIEVFNPHVNYTTIRPSVTANVGYRLNGQPMGSNKFEGLGALGTDSDDDKIFQLTVQLIEAIEDKIAKVLSGASEDEPIVGIIKEEI